MPGSDVGRAGFGPATNGLPIGISQKDVRIPAFPCAPDSFTSGRVRCDEPDSGYFSGIGGECAATDKPRAGLAVRADPEGRGQLRAQDSRLRGHAPPSSGTGKPGVIPTRQVSLG
jgi:hypothetical protein